LKVKSGKYVMPDSFSPALTDLIARMLCVNTEQRITIPEIKAHPAFGEGFPEGYTIPTPIPFTFSENPVEVDDEILKVLKHIGYDSKDEAFSELTKTGHSMAKVFYSMYKGNQTIEQLPWESMDVSDAPSEAFEVAGEAHEVQGGNVQGPFARRPRFVEPSMPEAFSLARRASWVLSLPPEEFEEGEVWERIRVGIVTLMTGLQKILVGAGYEYFHPNEFELIARKLGVSGYVILSAKPESCESLTLTSRRPAESSGDHELTLAIGTLVYDWADLDQCRP
jgi:BR serine/threonine kinase